MDFLRAEESAARPDFLEDSLTIVLRPLWGVGAIVGGGLRGRVWKRDGKAGAMDDVVIDGWLVAEGTRRDATLPVR